MKKKPTQSPARTLLEHVWEHANSKTNYSWERLNHSMVDALTLAIGSGMAFVVDDWNLSGFNAGRWVGETMERYYRMAVVTGNRSAIETFEAWRNRKPIIADDANMGGRYVYSGESGYTHGGGGTRQRERLVIHCSFLYQGEVVEVTSFTEDGAAVCCSYKNSDENRKNGTRLKILHRYAVTPELIQADRAERREKGKLIDALKVAANADDAPKDIGKQIPDFLKIPQESKESWLLTLPLKKLQAAAKKFCPATEETEEAAKKVA